jgi:hypothetical protein
MSTHPYLRAYLAGIFLTTLILPVMLTVFIVVRLVFRVPVPIERGLIFPMALVPAAWGLWNVLWLGTHERTHLAVGVHGAICPFILLPIGATVAHCLGVLAFGPTSATWFNACSIPYALIAAGFCFGVAAYYLVWKYIVGFLNRVLGIAS